MRLALYQPDIPPNTGTILRMAACLSIPVDVIGPTGFDMTDRALRRAGLDYLEHAEIARHESFSTFDAWRLAAGKRLVLATARADRTHLAYTFRPNDIVLMGRESAGVPDMIHQIADARIGIPMKNGMRSLNIAVAAAIIMGEALRQTGGFPRTDC